MVTRLQLGSMRWTWLITTAVVVVAVGSILWQEFSVRGVALCGLPVLFACGAWIFYGRPNVTLTDTGVRVTNPVRSTQVESTSVTSVDTTYGLQLRCSGKKINAWALTDMGSKKARSERASGEAPALPEIEMVTSHLTNVKKSKAETPPPRQKVDVLPLVLIGVSLAWFVWGMTAL